MIDKIIDKISEAINGEFGDDKEIFTEPVEQGLNAPCFSVLCINPSIILFRGKRYFRQNQFCIHYFSATSEPNAECLNVFERLSSCLEYIKIGTYYARCSEKITGALLVVADDVEVKQGEIRYSDCNILKVKPGEYVILKDEYLMGRNPRCEMDSGILHFFINFDLFTYNQDNEDITMTSYDYSTDVKG